MRERRTGAATYRMLPRVPRIVATTMVRSATSAASTKMPLVLKTSAGARPSESTRSEMEGGSCARMASLWAAAQLQMGRQHADAQVQEKADRHDQTAKEGNQGEQRENDARGCSQETGANAGVTCHGKLPMCYCGADYTMF